MPSCWIRNPSKRCREVVAPDIDIDEPRAGERGLERGGGGERQRVTLRVCDKNKQTTMTERLGERERDLEKHKSTKKSQKKQK